MFLKQKIPAGGRDFLFHAEESIKVCRSKRLEVAETAG
jgi:hypothetical protein